MSIRYFLSVIGTSQIEKYQKIVKYTESLKKKVLNMKIV